MARLSGGLIAAWLTAASCWAAQPAPAAGGHEGCLDDLQPAIAAGPGGRVGQGSAADLHRGHSTLPEAPAPHAQAHPGRPDQAAAPAARWTGGRDAVIWLTDAPPKRDGGGRRGAGGRPDTGDGHAGMAAMGRPGGAGPQDVARQRVWLRAGGNPQTARPATGSESALLQTPDGRTAELPVAPHGGPYNVTFPVPDQGYYNVYLVRQALERDTREVTAAKAEVVRGSMGHGMAKDEVARLAAARTDRRVPVEIVRLRKNEETLLTRVNYGDEIAFQVLHGGQPVQNARVTFTSGQGWSNSVQSDEDGRARFMVVRDYYAREWRLFDKRHRETYLVTATFTTPEAGTGMDGRYTSTRYTATLSGAYYPGVADYESYSDGLLIGMVGLLFSGSGVWLYRRRRVRPYREVRFGE